MGLRKEYFIGWDVGGWTCDKNRISRDAIVILDAKLNVVGQPWRGNLRKHINAYSTTSDWVMAILSLCTSPKKPENPVFALWQQTLL